MSRKSLVQGANCSTQTKYRLSRKLPMTICAWFRSRSQIQPQGNLRGPILRSSQRRSCCGRQGLSHSSCFSGLRVSPLAWKVAVERQLLSRFLQLCPALHGSMTLAGSHYHIRPSEIFKARALLWNYFMPTGARLHSPVWGPSRKTRCANLYCIAPSPTWSERNEQVCNREVRNHSWIDGYRAWNFILLLEGGFLEKTVFAFKWN